MDRNVLRRWHFRAREGFLPANRAKYAAACFELPASDDEGRKQ
jgi:hypothetical protein